jgi:DNA repair protein RecN (Recombination protein N)
VEKTVENDRTFTSAARLGPEERVREIARLLAGSRLTEASLQTAKEMLDRHKSDARKKT